MMSIDPLTAAGVVVATGATDAVYVMFTSAVVSRRRVAAATWSSLWYLLSSYAVISYTENWAYVGFAAAGSWCPESEVRYILRHTRERTSDSKG
ncbi:MAG: hypothetical protein ACLP8B_15355, partial [Xanthobacteraceae bacterium]